MRARAQIITTVILYVAATVAVGFASWLFWKARPAITAAVNAQAEIPVNTQSCVDVGRKLNLEVVEVAGGTIQTSLKNMTNPELAFGRASSLVASCRGYELSYFCAGPGCSVNNGKELQLRLLPKRSRE